MRHSRLCPKCGCCMDCGSPVRGGTGCCVGQLPSGNPMPQEKGLKWIPHEIDNDYCLWRQSQREYK